LPIGYRVLVTLTRKDLDYAADIVTAAVLWFEGTRILDTVGSDEVAAPGFVAKELLRDPVKEYVERMRERDERIDALRNAAKYTLRRYLEDEPKHHLYLSRDIAFRTLLEFHRRLAQGRGAGNGK